MYDIIVVGAGPAGLTAAIYARRANKKVLVLEAKSYGGQIINAHNVENYPGIASISGFDLATNMYNQVKEGSRAKEYENALLWLSDCGLIKKISRISKPAMPPSAYEDLKAFKVYLLDVGLLGALSEISARTLIDGNRIFTEFKGALTEQYVCQQLTASSVPLFYWTRKRGNAEVDFIIQNGENILPVEVKAETNLQAKSLKVYYEKYAPKIAVRTSMADYERQDWLMNIPLYAVELLARENII